MVGKIKTLQDSTKKQKVKKMSTLNVQRDVNAINHEATCRRLVGTGPGVRTSEQGRGEDPAQQDREDAARHHLGGGHRHEHVGELADYPGPVPRSWPPGRGTAVPRLGRVLWHRRQARDQDPV